MGSNARPMQQKSGRVIKRNEQTAVERKYCGGGRCNN